MDFMQDFSYHFGLRMYDCGKKLNYKNGLAPDILNFWNEDYRLNNMGFGCLVACALVSFDLVDIDGSLKTANTIAYLMAHGADEPSSKTVIAIYTACWQSIPGDNHCEAAARVADCFREGTAQLLGSPDLKAVLSRRAGCYRY